MRSYGILVVLTLAVLSAQPAHSDSLINHDRCAAKMSCVNKAPPYSQRPAMDSLRMSVMANAPDVPAACVKNVMGELDRAQLALCEAFVAADSGSPRERATALINIGHAYVWLKDANASITPVHALVYWDKAIAEDPSFAEPWALKGEVAIRGAQNKLTAIPFFEEAIALDPAHWRAMLGLAKIRVDLGQTEEALKLASEAIALAPEVSVAHQLRGHILRRAGRLEDALKEYTKATLGYDYTKIRMPGLWQEDPPWGMIAAVEMQMKRPARAAAAISKLIDGRPEQTINPLDVLIRGEYYEALNLPQKAADDFEWGVRLLPPDDIYVERYRHRAAMLRAMTDNDGPARAAFHDLIRSGRPQAILRIQVFLRNNGFDEVKIDGKPSATLDAALDQCLRIKDCASGLGQPI